MRLVLKIAAGVILGALALLALVFAASAVGNLREGCPAVGPCRR